MKVQRLFADIPVDLPEEHFDELLRTPGLRLERIVSRGHATPRGEWCEQAWDEWVVVLRGEAVLGFEGAPDLRLSPGEGLLLPAGTRHRVQWTDPATDTIWLALHYGKFS